MTWVPSHFTHAGWLGAQIRRWIARRFARRNV